MQAMDSKRGASGDRPSSSRLHGWIVIAIAGVAFLGAISSPPSLLDDVDSTYAQIARDMLQSGDWVTARINGVPYFDKPPGQVWAMALSFAIFGVQEWAARLPAALAAILLCWLTWNVGRWSFGDRDGLYAGIGLATCCGLFLFTRVRIPDVYVACTTLFVLACFLRSQEGSARQARARMRWAGAALGVGLLFKGLVAAVLPLGAIAVYMFAVGKWRSSEAWSRLGLPSALATTLLVAAPWHVLAILQHPPFFELALESEPGAYRGFFWRYFVNEHLLRYLGLRYPVDYDRVNIAWFWIGHAVWLFPWSGLLAGIRKLGLGSADRKRRTQSLMLSACGFTLLFFSASTTQEYYTLPAYAPAMLLLASAASSSALLTRWCMRVAATVYACALLAALTVLWAVGDLPSEGDIASALTSNPEAYTLALGHFQDLTLAAFAYLRGPLALAAVAFAIGALGGWLLRQSWALGSLACAALMLLQAAHWAMGTFDPYLSSRPLADAYLRSPAGHLVLDHEYYAFSSLVYYTNQQALLLNGRKNNIEYGSNAPGAADVFLDDSALLELWKQQRPVYLATYEQDRERFIRLLGERQVHTVAAGGGKVLLANRTVPSEQSAR